MPSVGAGARSATPYSTTKDTKNTKNTKLEHKAPNPLPEQWDVEVHQKAQTPTRKLQVGQDLRLAEAGQSVNSLDLNDEHILEKDIEAISCLNRNVSIGNRQGDLSAKRQAARLEFVGETVLVRRFQQPRTKRLVNLQTTVDGGPRQAVQTWSNTLVILVFLVVQCGLRLREVGRWSADGCKS